MFTKKGMEMSMNIVVGIILGIAMLSAGIFLFFKIMDKTDEATKTLDDQTKAKIIQALDSGDPVFVPMSNLEVKKGYADFWVGIRNINANARNFRVTIQPIEDIGNRVIYNPGPYNIVAKESKVDILVSVDMRGINQKASLLVFVEIESETGEWIEYWNPKIVNIKP